MDTFDVKAQGSPLVAHLLTTRAAPATKVPDTNLVTLQESCHVFNLSTSTGTVIYAGLVLLHFKPAVYKPRGRYNIEGAGA